VAVAARHGARARAVAADDDNAAGDSSAAVGPTAEPKAEPDAEIAASGGPNIEPEPTRDDASGMRANAASEAPVSARADDSSDDLDDEPTSAFASRAPASDDLDDEPTSAFASRGLDDDAPTSAFVRPAPPTRSLPLPAAAPPRHARAAASPAAAGASARRRFARGSNAADHAATPAQSAAARALAAARASATAGQIAAKQAPLPRLSQRRPPGVPDNRP
jgi:hypothetical protein